MNIQTQPLPLYSVILHSFILYMSSIVLSGSKRFILTRKHKDNILKPLSAHLKGGKTKPEHMGFNKPVIELVFYCHSKIKASSTRVLNSVMAGLLGNSKELPFYVRFFVDPFNPATYARQKHSGGLHPQHIGRPKMSVISILNELKAEVKALRAEIAELKAEKIQNTTNTATPVQAVQPVAHSKPKQDRILRLPEVLQITGFKRTSFYAKLKQGLFKKIQLSERSVGFFESEIYAFVQSLSVAGGVA